MPATNTRGVCRRYDTFLIITLFKHFFATGEGFHSYVHTINTLVDTAAEINWGLHNWKNRDTVKI